MKSFNDRVHEMIECLEYFQVDGTPEYDGCAANMEVHDNNKRGLIDLLSKHPNWDDDNQRVVLTRKEWREIDYVRAVTAFNDIRFFLWNYGYIVSELRRDLRRVSEALINTKSMVVTEEAIELLPNSIKDATRCRVGQKWTKVIRKYLRTIGNVEGHPDIFEKAVYGDEFVHEIEQMYATFADSLSEMAIDRTFVISVNYCDYLSMSHGNSWCSCHYINSNDLFHEHDDGRYSGCYKAGTLSYANDSVSIIAFVLPDDYDTSVPMWKLKKIRRQMFHYDNGMLIQGRLYPCAGNDEIRDAYRKIIQSVIAECEGRANLWKKINDGISQHAVTYDGALHYPDYHHDHGNAGSYRCTDSILTALVDEDCSADRYVTIGYTAYDVSDGCVLEDNDSLFCDAYRCYYCHCRVNEDAFQDDDGDYLCEDCFSQRYTRCEHCGDAVRYGDIHHTDDGYGLCCWCYDINTTMCEHCQQTFYDEGCVEIRQTEDGYYLCECCWDERAALCHDCGDVVYHHTTGEDGNVRCSDCHHAHEMELEADSECTDCNDTEQTRAS